MLRHCKPSRKKYFQRVRLDHGRQIYTSEGTITSDAYKRAGVDIDAAADLVERIKPLAKSTARAGMAGGLGGFGALFDVAAAGYRDPILVAATDGVGTKLKIATLVDRHDTIGIDLVAMCVNDLVVQGAEPLFFLDYFATGGLQTDKAAEVISGIAAGCREAGCGLIGGETAEMPGMYAAGEYDLAGFSVGAVERDKVLDGTGVVAGDILLGLAASGVHSNGFSLVRDVIARAGVDAAAPAPFAPDKTLGEILLTPTRIYVQSCLAAVRAGTVAALAHITGGGLPENLPRVLPDGLSAHIDASTWPLPAVFAWLAEAGGLTVRDLLRTFNCGVGMVVVVPAARADDAERILRDAGETVWRIGHIVESQEGRERVRITGTQAWPAKAAP